MLTEIPRFVEEGSECGIGTFSDMGHDQIYDLLAVSSRDLKTFPCSTPFCHGVSTADEDV